MRRIHRFNINRINSAYSKASYMNEGVMTEEDKVRLDALWAAMDSGEGIKDVHIHFDGNEYLESIKNQIERQETTIDELFDMMMALDSSKCNCKEIFGTLVDKEYLESILEDYTKESEITEKLNVNLITPPPQHLVGTQRLISAA